MTNISTDTHNAYIGYIYNLCVRVCAACACVHACEARIERRPNVVGLLPNSLSAEVRVHVAIFITNVEIDARERREDIHACGGDGEVEEDNEVTERLSVEERSSKN